MFFIVSCDILSQLNANKPLIKVLLFIYEYDVFS